MPPALLPLARCATVVAMQLISPVEAAKRLKKHKSTVYRMIDREEVKVGKRTVEELGVWWDEAKGELVKPE